MNGALTCNQLIVLLNYYRGTEYAIVENGPEAVDLQRRGYIQYCCHKTHIHDFEITAKGRAYCDKVLSTPSPKQMWVY